MGACALRQEEENEDNGAGNEVRTEEAVEVEDVEDVSSYLRLNRHSF